jgi:hypothetical protein
MVLGKNLQLARTSFCNVEHLPFFVVATVSSLRWMGLKSMDEEHIPTAPRKYALLHT